MPTYISPEAGEIEAPDGYTAAWWLLHRLTHARSGERAIVRQRQIWPLAGWSDAWTASAWMGAPARGGSALEYAGLNVYSLDELLAQASYMQ